MSFSQPPAIGSLFARVRRISARSYVGATAVAVVLTAALTVVYPAVNVRSFIVNMVGGIWLATAVAPLAVHVVRPEAAHERALRWLVWSMPLAVAVGQIWRYGSDLRQWDLMWVSVWLVLVVGWLLAVGAPERLRRTIQRLHDRQVLVGDQAYVADVSAALGRTARRAAVVCATCLAVVYALTGPWFDTRVFRDASLWPGPGGAEYFLPSLIAMFVAGGWLGRLIAYGRLGVLLRKLGLRLHVVPGHPDGAGGLQPIGAYFMYQSLIASLPAVFLIAWLVIVALGGLPAFAETYRAYTTTYTFLIGLAILIEILAFLAPLRSIHRLMREEKETGIWDEADQVSRQIEQANVDREVSEQRVADLTRRFEMLEATPTWPINPSIRRRFTLRNLGLLVGLIGPALGNQQFWERLSTMFTGLD